MKNDPNKDGEKLLRQLAEESIVQDHLGRKILLIDVIDHLRMKPYEPLPPDLIKVLDQWLQAKSGSRIVNAKAGRKSADWYPKAERLVDNGLSIEQACDRILASENPPKLAHHSMVRMFNRHLDKRTEAQKWADRKIRELLDRDNPPLD
jgi:hypothetical protein